MIYEVEKHIPHPHPHETGADVYFDIMLLKLKKPINRNIREPTEEQCRRTNPLLTERHNPEPLRFLVAGHGIYGYDFRKPDPVRYPLFTDKLQCVTINLTRCPPNRKNNPKYSKNRFCAGGGGKATRQGDSGGGLVINEVVYGVVHRGWVNNIKGLYPGIYINVCEFLHWIKKTAV
ncbi:trypsin-like [Arapaima gigas]